MISPRSNRIPSRTDTVVDNGMDQLAGRDRALDGIEEADELLVPVSLHAAAEDDAIERVKGGKQRYYRLSLSLFEHSPAISDS